MTMPPSARRASTRLLLRPATLAASAAMLAALTCGRPADARDAPPLDPGETAVDVRFEKAPSPHRVATLEWNPLALFVDRFSLGVVLVPGDHHALVVSAFYTWADTAEYSTGLNANGTPLIDTTGSITGTPGSTYNLNVPRQTFTGFGGELGYRYYVDRGGPRGLFAGPSFIVEGITAKAFNGSETSFAGYGIAADVGYEALVADRVAVSLGAGAQYLWTSKTIPAQQLPASIYANEKLYPRLLLSFGYAL